MSEPEWIPPAPVSEEYLDYLRRVREWTWNRLMERCCIPKELLYPDESKKGNDDGR